MSGKLKPILFGPRQGKEPYNASEVVALGDSRFLFCDNNVSDALFEFRLRRSGALATKVRKRRITGLPAEAIDDLEGLEIVKEAGKTFIFATSSMSRPRKGRGRKGKRGKVPASRTSILRIRVGRSGAVRAEVLEGFRPWLVEQVPWLERAASLAPDDGGLNVEALSWDPREKALLFGLRTPLLKGQPVLLRVRPRRFAGPWTLDNLEVLPPLRLAVPEADGESGIRAMSLDRSTGLSLLILGNATSHSKTRFRLYSWDGNPRGAVRRFEDVKFGKRMKVEGVTRGTVAGRPVVVFVDDAGGYQLLWGDDPRLVVPRRARGK